MGLSSICLPQVETIFSLKRRDLGDACYSMIRRFKRDIDESAAAITVDWVESSEYFWPLLHNILGDTLNMVNINRKLTSQQQSTITSEADFITYVRIPRLSFVLWDVRTAAYDGADRRKRPDFTICSIDSVEVGHCEEKPHTASITKVEKVRCQVLQRMKKHLQIALEEKELATFIFFVINSK